MTVEHRARHAYPLLAGRDRLELSIKGFLFVSLSVLPGLCLHLACALGGRSTSCGLHASIDFHSVEIKPDIFQGRIRI